MFSLLRKLWSLKGQAEQNVKALEHAQTAYARGASLPGILRVYGGTTDAAGDDRADDAVLAALGEFKQTVYNSAEILRGVVSLAEGTARQLDQLFEFLDRAEKGSLRELLEGDGGDHA